VELPTTVLKLTTLFYAVNYLGDTFFENVVVPKSKSNELFLNQNIKLNKNIYY